MENGPFEDVFPTEEGDFPLPCAFTGVSFPEILRVSAFETCPAAPPWDPNLFWSLKIGSLDDVNVECLISWGCLEHIFRPFVMHILLGFFLKREHVKERIWIPNPHRWKRWTFWLQGKDQDVGNDHKIYTFSTSRFLLLPTGKLVVLILGRSQNFLPRAQKPFMSQTITSCHWQTPAPDDRCYFTILLMEEILHQLILGESPIFHRVS